MSYKTTTVSGTGAQTALTKPRNENCVLASLSGTAYGGLQFTFEGSADGTNWAPVAVIDVKTGLLVAGGTTIAPTDNSEYNWLWPLAGNFTGLRMNVSALTSGSATMNYYGSTQAGQPLYSSVAGAAGAFTNLTASGTLGVTGVATFSGHAIFPDNSSLKLGTGEDIVFTWDGTDLDVTQATANSSIKWGVDGAGIDHVFYGDTASTNMTWDQSADSLIMNGAARLVFTGTTGQPEIHLTDNLADALSIEISGSTDLMVFTTTDSAESVQIRGLRNTQTTAVLITGATTVLLADSGGVFTVDQDAAFDIDLPSPTSGPGCRYLFIVHDNGANNVTITVAGGAATFIGTIVNDVTSVLPCTGSTITFVSGSTAIGDWVEAISLTTSLYMIRAVTSTAGGITIA